MALAAGSIGTWIFDPVLQIFDLDAQSATIFGWPTEATTASLAAVLRLVNKDDRERITEAIHANDTTTPTKRFEFAVRTSTGEMRHVAARAINVAKPGDGKAHMVGVFHDATDQRAAEQRIMLAQAGAERANLAKSAFLANMSHELRTPLNSVLGFSEILMDELFGQHSAPQYREYAELIHRSGTHLLNVINDILDVSRIEAGALDIDPSEFDLAEVIAEAVKMVEFHVEKRSQRIVADLGFETIIYADRRLIKQVVLNILSNAVKFAGDGGNISVRIDYSAALGVDVVITDDGIGMTERDIAMVMMPFVQVANSMTRDHEGTGLGLPISMGIIKAHEGNLLIKSGLGEGTAVTISLPASRHMPKQQVSQVSA